MANFHTGHSTVTTTKQLDSLGFIAHNSIRIRADADNDSHILVASSEGVADGYRLLAGDELVIGAGSARATTDIWVTGDGEQGYSYLVD